LVVICTREFKEDDRFFEPAPREVTITTYNPRIGRQQDLLVSPDSSNPFTVKERVEVIKGGVYSAAIENSGKNAGS
jgi:hypothetical protein